MRAITAAQQAVLNSGVQAEYARVKVKDDGGTWRDLTTYGGFNAVKTVTWNDNIESPHATFDISVFREQYRLSLSPYVEDSALNHDFDPSTPYAALLQIGRELKVEVAIVAMDSTPSSGDWFLEFHGSIDTLDTAKDETIGLVGRAIISGRLAQQYIKQERVYSYAADGGHAVSLRLWEPNQVFAAGEYGLPASRGDSDPGLNKFLKIHTPGTTDPVNEPIWTTGAAQADGTASWDYVGAPTTSGNPVEQIIQNILDDGRFASDPAVTLYTPTSPSWAITEFLQPRGYTFDLIIALANQIGWTIRSKYRAGTAQFELTLFTPNRSSPSVDFTFGPSDYGKPTELSVDITLIRNAWTLFYGDASDLWPDGTPKRKKVEVTDPASIAKYKQELWAEIQEDQASQINSSAEANALINAALSDCSEPTAQLAVPLCRGFPWVELNDFYTFAANGQHFDSDQSLAVTSFSHTSEGGKGISTKLMLRGKPTIGARAHIGRSQHSVIPPKFQPHQFQHFNGAKTATPIFRPIVGGHRIEMSQSFTQRQLAEEYEHHVYTTPGATLDGTTIKAVSRDRVLELGDLVPGKTHYHRVRPRFRNAERLIVLQPSSEQSFVAGRAAAGHLSADPDLTSLPLNGGFEMQFDPTAPPDHTAMHSGTWSTDVELITDSSGKSGTNYLHFKPTAVAKEIRFDPFIVASGGLYRLDFLVKDQTVGHAQCTVRVKWLDSTRAEISGSEITVVSGGVPTWALGWGAVIAPSNARWARVDVFQTDPSDAHGFYVDRLQVRQLQLTGVLTFGNGTLPSTNVTNYLQPGGTTGAIDATERSIPLVLPAGGAVLLAGTRYFARVAQLGMSYAMTLRVNGVDSANTFTVGSSNATGGDTDHAVFANDGDTLSVKCVATQTGGGGHTGASDGFVTVSVYS
jgi:hypothetical protein